MLQSILDNNWQFAPWEHDCPRFKKLRYLDAWLKGEFYDPIKIPFAQEEGGNGKYIPIYQRRPAVQQNMPKMIAGLCARKLFGGRHAPRIRHQDDKIKLAVQAFIEELHLISKMLEVVKRGSVGSVLVLFRFENLKGRVKSLIEITKARHVTPHFDEFQELDRVRIHYPTNAKHFVDYGMEVDYKERPLKDSVMYWFVRDLTVTEDCIYHPIPETEWNPVHGPDSKCLREAVKVNNGIGFLPAVWIKNLAGGDGPDGDCTFSSSLNSFIEQDYMLSQIGRGLYYHAGPLLVVKGGLAGDDEEDGDKKNSPQSTAHILQLPGDDKDPNGGVTGHDAKLLETSGDGLKTGIDFAAKLKHGSLEQSSVARKDLESIKGSMSGKAMELIDQEFLDLIQELRVQYCEYGYLPLLKKLCKAASAVGHPLMAKLSEKDIDGITLQYPAYYTPDPQEFLYLCQGLALATGLGQKSAEGGVNGAAAPVAPHEGLLTIEEAALYLKTQMDFYMISEDVPVLPDTELATDKPELPQPSANISTAEEGMDITEQYPKGNTPTSVPVMNRPF